MEREEGAGKQEDSFSRWKGEYIPSLSLFHNRKINKSRSSKLYDLGGLFFTQPVKKQRLPLSVARVTMKKQKEREEKMLKEVILFSNYPFSLICSEFLNDVLLRTIIWQSLILGQFGGMVSSGRKRTEKRKPEERVLMASEGRFKNGVLDVKHLLQPAKVSTAREGHDGGYRGVNTGKKKKGRGKKNKGKKGGDRKRH